MLEWPGGLTRQADLDCLVRRNSQLLTTPSR